MNNRLSKTSVEFLRAYPSWIAVLTTLFFLRVFEYFSFQQQLTTAENNIALVRGWGNDLLFILSLAFLLFIPAFILWLIKPRLASWVFTITCIVVLVANVLLSRYFITTKTLLGADLFGYSVDDIKTTIGSSTTFSIIDLLPLLLIGVLVFLKYKSGIRKKLLPAYFSVAILIIGSVCMFYLNAFATTKTGLEKNMAVNKMAYFLSASFSSQTSTRTLQFSNFPLSHTDNSKDALSSFLKLNNDKPNIVVLIVEGLGRDFTGPSAQYGGFTPFLDSLANESLYWTNFLSTAGRSFAGLPSILGSLPYGIKGFNELGQNMPEHYSLISLLKQNGYYTSFFYGGNANFDKQDLFLEKQGIDFILDENKFGNNYQRHFDDKYSWGYADGDLFKRSLEVLQTAPTQPKLNIFFTLSTHEPFAIPNKSVYEKKVDARLAQLNTTDQKRYQPHKPVWESLMYCDESIRQYISEYASRPDFANTIFIITGDHRLIPVEEEHALSRFHVPLMIYSPMLTRKKQFTALSTHLDITPSLLKLLGHYQDIMLPSEVHWMGKGLDTLEKLNPSFEAPLMRNKNTLDDYIVDDVFLSGSEVYQLNNNLQLLPLTNKKSVAIAKAKT